MRKRGPPCDGFGAWRSLASALDWGSRGRRFKSCRPDIGRSGIVDSPCALRDRSVCGRAAVVEIVFIVEEAAEGGFTARAVGESIFTEGDTLEAVRDNVRDAVECHFEEGHTPKIIRLHFVRDEILSP